MKLTLVLGDKIKEFELGESQYAQAAIKAYEIYLINGAHQLVFPFHKALNLLLATSPKEIKENVCHILAEHARFKFTTETDVYKQAYFAALANDAYLAANWKLDPEWMSILRRYNALVMQNFDKKKAIEVGLSVLEVELPHFVYPEVMQVLNTLGFQFFTPARPLLAPKQVLRPSPPLITNPKQILFKAPPPFTSDGSGCLFRRRKNFIKSNDETECLTRLPYQPRI